MHQSPPKTQWFLTPEQFKKAVGNWELERTDFSNIKNLIDPTHVFYFSEEGRKWINENNNYPSFHACAGVHNGTFVLIIRPLDRSGKPKPLDEYLAVGLQPLKKELTLVEAPVFNTRISTGLEIKSFDTPSYNRPTITERAAVKDIESWKYDCLSWFCYETKAPQGGGKNIFNSFSVPFPDLYTEGDSNGEVIALFGLKFSFVFQKVLPVLIFVDEPNKVIMRLYSNTRDWSHPSPPYC
jgi:hypothetical protein